MPKATLISITDLDPDLASGLTPAQLADARERVQVRTVLLERGDWDEAPEAEAIAYLALDGFLLRSVAIGSRGCPILIGPGDVFQLPDVEEREAHIATPAGFRVIEPMRVALVESGTLESAQHFPAMFAALARRFERRVSRLGAQQAITQISGMEQRVLALLWFLAHEWGRVTADGVLLPVALTHETLASLVGARRPSVTTAIGRLEQAGDVSRRPDRTWMLMGTPPSEPRPRRTSQQRVRASEPSELSAIRERAGARRDESRTLRAELARQRAERIATRKARGAPEPPA